MNSFVQEVSFHNGDMTVKFANPAEHPVLSVTGPAGSPLMGQQLDHMMGAHAPGLEAALAEAAAKGKPHGVPTDETGIMGVPPIPGRMGPVVRRSEDISLLHSGSPEHSNHLSQFAHDPSLAEASRHSTPPHHPAGHPVMTHGGAHLGAGTHATPGGAVRQPVHHQGVAVDQPLHSLGM